MLDDLPGTTVIALRSSLTWRSNDTGRKGGADSEIVGLLNCLPEHRTMTMTTRRPTRRTARNRRASDQGEQQDDRAAHVRVGRVVRAPSGGHP
ncbi:hypothetical protein ACWGH8_39035 [Nonomuraea muscovyensis]|uniref:hypothetical protein n=1 Tax=Nonomuraea muscovyensis TaxID=1124761 RepID=UPI0033FA69F4